MHTTTRIAGIAAAAALTFGSLAGTATATASTGPDREPCAQQQMQLDKAEAALERVTAVFAHQKVKVAKAEDRAEAADTARERSAARQGLRAARHDREEARETKRAQRQRVAKAQERLDACQAEPDQTAQPVG